MRRGPKPETSAKAKPSVARTSSRNEGARARDLEERLAEALRREAEALGRETATSEILRVISRSPTDTQPVFDAIAESARRLLRGWSALVLRFDGRMLHAAAISGGASGSAEVLRERFPIVAERGMDFAGDAILDREVNVVEDVEGETRWPGMRDRARRRGWRAILAVPMLQDGEPIGGITVTRVEPGPFAPQDIGLLQTFADQAVIAIANVRLFNETKEALERQTATSEILRTISSSPTDLQPVFTTILVNANRLCDASFSLLWLWDGETARAVAHENVSPEFAELLRTARPGPDPRSPLGLTLMDRTVIHVPDVLADSRFTPADVPSYRHGGARSILAVPMLLEGDLVGVINAWRREPRAFADHQVELLKTFASQAVIAIENVRLFKELQDRNQALTHAHAAVSEALDQQTTTGEILRVIASSPTDLQPVLDALVVGAGRLCQAPDTFLLLVEGNQLRVAALHVSGERTEELSNYSNSIHRGWVAGRAVVDSRPIQVEDLASAEADFPLGTELARRVGHRTALGIPLFRNGVAIGVLFLRRREVRLFSDNEIALLRTFADQAVIAIENTRLFRELEQRNHDLTTALDRQTATSETLRVISSSPTDVQPVFDVIARNAVTLCGGIRALVLRFDGEALHVAGHANMSPDVAGRGLPRRPERDRPADRALLERRVVHVPDLQAAMEFAASTAWQRGVRSLLAVPLLREQEAIGVIGVARDTVGPFSSAQIEVLQTFADQAVIAIENVRLFKELEAANRELAAASRHKSEFLANMSHELRTPLNAIIGFSEVLAERMFGELNERQEEYLKDIHASGQHLLSLINDILDLSKIEAGRMELELTDFDLAAAIDNALTLVRERAGRRGIALHHAVDEQLGQIRGDERKLKQVLLNLLSNAIKFTPEGGRIDVRAALVDGLAEVAVADTGEGIATEDQEAIFEEFRQVGTADKKVEGTGLGLTLCRKFVELHGGRIWVTSQAGAGATFTFTIPIGR